MVVDTHQRDYAMFHAPQTLAAEYLESVFHKHLGITRHMLIRAKADFIAADMPKGSFIVLEMKTGTEQLGARQISAYLRMLATQGGLYISPLEREAERDRILVHEDTETLPELVKVARPIEITYLNQKLVEGLLGNNGKYVLEQVLKVVKDVALETDWPLDRIDIRYVRDPEVKDWEYVLLLLVFSCDFDTADRHLHELYNQLDMLTAKLSDKEQKILQRMIFFDIETKASVSST